MFPIIRAAQKDREIKCLTFCAGMHMSERFGSTWKQLEKDEIEITEKIEFPLEDDQPESLAHCLGYEAIEFSQALARNKPDIMCISGDRIENLPLLTAATVLGIPIAHLSGGDITEGAFDNQIRHATTKLSHLHFVCMEEHARRVIQMGEEPWRVKVTGDAALDFVETFKPIDRSLLLNVLQVPEHRDFFLSIFHPQTLSSTTATFRYANILEAVAEVDATPIMIYPNIDPGFEQLIAMLEKFLEKRPDTVVRKSFDREHYYSLMHHALFMIGNSSSGIWEAPSFSLPAINVGDRQAGRRRSKNVIDVSGETKVEITQAIQKAIEPSFLISLRGIQNPFGNGKATQKTLEVLKDVKLDNHLINKKFHELATNESGTGIEEAN